MTPLSDSKRKIFISLSNAKGRKEHGLFIVEGERALNELAESSFMRCKALIALKGYEIPDRLRPLGTEAVYEVSASDMKKISNLVTPPEIAGVFSIPQHTLPDTEYFGTHLSLSLDDIQDPGNMGTIIRLADWWGIYCILCSPNTVDCYNPKVVQSAMGALSRVRVFKPANYHEILSGFNDNGIPVYGTYLNGDNIFETSLTTNGVIVLGNEGNGITQDTSRLVTRRITIPSFPPGVKHVESLNVGIAAAVIISQFRNIKI